MSLALPQGAQVEMARRYLGTIGTVGAGSHALTFDGTPVTASLIGFAGPTCWPEQLNANNVNRAYRADVTALVVESGTYVEAGRGHLPGEMVSFERQTVCRHARIVAAV